MAWNDSSVLWAFDPSLAHIICLTTSTVVANTMLMKVVINQYKAHRTDWPTRAYTWFWKPHRLYFSNFSQIWPNIDDFRCPHRQWHIPSKMPNSALLDSGLVEIQRLIWGNTVTSHHGRSQCNAGMFHIYKKTSAKTVSGGDRHGLQNVA